MSDWTTGTQIAANLATAAGVVGLGLAYVQLRSSRKAQREATAIGIWKDYLQLALQYPTLSLPEAHLILHERGSENYRRYEWFVSAMLFACEQVLALEARSPEWLGTIESQLSYHTLYLHTKDFEPAHYSEPLQAAIKRQLSLSAPHPQLPTEMIRRLV